ncbi:hypothetical protein L6164_013253 [Bauhinia variegata]|uniref:Uncharacterized protein n=1 Tax=Bauhinia variegata TaxID=167791 RepID=A0ACB9PCU8_BAUVA|nr:hypothetical protein L6164_013253 [Bauhinia variegata]
MITAKDKLVKFVSLAIPTYLWEWTSWSNIPTMASDRLKPGDFLDTAGKLLSENEISPILLDNGNFVLQELHPNGSTKRFLWQSFDYPSDTLLPEMKLGVNYKTGHSWSLASWLTKRYPSPEQLAGKNVATMLVLDIGICLLKMKLVAFLFMETADESTYFVLKNSEMEHKGTKRWIWVSAVIAGALLMSCAGIIYLARKRRKAQTKTTADAVHDLVTFYGSGDVNELSKEENGHGITAWDLWKDGLGLDMLDPSMNGSFISEQVLRCIHVALLCTQERPVDRPSMSDVLSMLTNESAVLPLPKRPAFYFRKMSNVAAVCLQKSENILRNDFFVSDLQAR